MFRPPSLHASRIAPTAASLLAGQPRLFTSEQNVRRYLRTHRTCYPPDYRQLAGRGLSPRKIRSLVGCSRMMPTFPPSPLKFRTAGFPQSGFKVGISGGAFPSTTSPSCCAVCLRPSCTPLPASYPRSEPRGAVRWRTSVQAAVPLCPRGPRSSPGYSVPDHHHLIGPMRPTHRHISISPTRLIRAALAVRPNSTPRQPASGSVLSLAILCQHVAL